MVDIESFYPIIETGYLFTPDKEEEFIQWFNNRTFTQLKDTASAILRVRYFDPKCQIFQHLPVEEDMILHVKKYKVVKRLRNG